MSWKTKHIGYNLPLDREDYGWPELEDNMKHKNDEVYRFNCRLCKKTVYTQKKTSIELCTSCEVRQTHEVNKTTEG